MTRTFQQMSDEAMARRYELIRGGEDPEHHEFLVTPEELKLMGKRFHDYNEPQAVYGDHLWGLKLVRKP